jgi:hypothetical protein
VQGYTVGRIDGVRIGPDGPVLLSGGMEIPLGRVTSVESK